MPLLMQKYLGLLFIGGTWEIYGALIASNSLFWVWGLL